MIDFRKLFKNNPSDNDNQNIVTENMVGEELSELFSFIIERQLQNKTPDTIMREFQNLCKKDNFINLKRLTEEIGEADANGIHRVIIRIYWSMLEDLSNAISEYGADCFYKLVEMVFISITNLAELSKKKKIPKVETNNSLNKGTTTQGNLNDSGKNTKDKSKKDDKKSSKSNSVPK